MMYSRLGVLSGLLLGPVIYMLFVVAFVMYWRNWVVTIENLWSARLTVFTIWPYGESLPTPAIDNPAEMPASKCCFSRTVPNILCSLPSSLSWHILISSSELRGYVDIAHVYCTFIIYFIKHKCLILTFKIKFSERTQQYFFKLKYH